MSASRLAAPCKTIVPQRRRCLLSGRDTHRAIRLADSAPLIAIAAMASESTMFQPANESPRKRHCASSQAMATAVARSGSPPDRPAPPAHDGGPGHHFHSMPAW